MRLTVRDPSDLGALNDAVHDRWGDIDGMRYDPESRILTIRFWSRPSRSWRRFPVARAHEVLDAELQVHQVVDFQLEDSEKIGYYAFNEVHWDPGQSRVLIRAEPNLLLTIKVDALDVWVVCPSDDEVHR
jgi:hypothetical protein